VLHRLVGCVVAVTLGLAGAGCAASAAGSPRTAAASPAPSPSRQPAEGAGGACQLVNYEQVSAALGVTFEVAAASSNGDTYTCVLQRVDHDLPDLSLAVSPTLADPTVFKATVVPKGAATFTDLGKIGYSMALPAADGAGPGVEVGWLSGNQRLMSLRYRSPAGTAPDTAAALTPKLVALAKKIDQASV
jgi:hypothetical protein